MLRKHLAGGSFGQADFWDENLTESGLLQSLLTDLGGG